ncbi:MAG: hypothetical protein IPN17_16920 [Deltaproteobacteria bacterium]|jgi:hypothetical protein|nr:hypothetical protein [Deltaproteobacteria bacterium]MBK8693917.1 hypothetical protein [Deltaproteobacteria bacterium]MBP6830523.1 hypothetical protein [Deltaproteobacteria bacterium]
MNPGADSSMMSAMTIQMLAAGLFAGMALLGLGTSIGNQRANREAGLHPLALLLKGAGLATLSLTVYHFIKSHS